MFNGDKWQTRTGRLLFAVIVLLIIYVLLKYAMGLILPILGAWAISSAVFGLADKSSKRLKGNMHAWSIFYVSVFWGLIFVGLLAVAVRVGREARDFFEYILLNFDKISARLQEFADGVAEWISKIPFLNKSGQLDNVSSSLGGALSSIMQSIAEKGSALLANGVGSLIIGTPKAVISLAVCIISSFYMSVDYQKIKDYILGIFSSDNQQKIKQLLGRTFRGIKGYARAYFFLFLITFTELYLGLILLNREYSFLIALVVAALDLLPLFGAGLVLVPWAIILIIGKSYAVGIGMLVLFAVITVVRQIAEPRLVGKSLGIHPLASLISIFVGFRLFGFWGMILAPVGVLVAKEFIDERKAIKK